MFDWFRPQCPVEPELKTWIEDRTHWLVREFGLERMCDAKVILPTQEFFPDHFDGSEDAVLDLFSRVGRYMGVDTSPIELAFYSEANRPKLEDESGRPIGGSAGMYQNDGQITIWIEVSQLHDPLAVVATLAHELGHVLLLGQNRISDEEEDHEPLTDLLMVYLGVGVFPANATIRESYWHEGQVSGWSIGRQGYLDQRMYGYAFALFAWLRGETSPEWAKHLRLDVRSAFKQGLRYLHKTGDSSLHPLRGPFLAKRANDLQT